MRRFPRVRRNRLPVPVLALAFLVLMAPSARAGTPTVDPATLQPVPPPGAECRLDGRFVICHTELHLAIQNEPVFDLPCGTVYETSTDDRAGIRWYSNGLLVRRRVTAVLAGFWTLSPDGSGPRLRISAHWNWWAIPAVPGGDMDTEALTAHGNSFTATAPNGGVIAHIAGIDLPDGTHHGTAAFLDDPEVAAAVCDALS